MSGPMCHEFVDVSGSQGYGAVTGLLWALLLGLPPEGRWGAGGGELEGSRCRRPAALLEVSFSFRYGY